MKIFKNIWQFKKLIGFTLLNSIVFLFGKILHFLIDYSFIYVIGYLFIDYLLELSYVSYFNAMPYVLLLKIAIWIFSKKSIK